MAPTDQGPEVSLDLWNEGSAKQAIIDFVSDVSTEGSPDYVRPAERIAVFDNDGTLWLEKPIYTQLVFAMDIAKEVASTNDSLGEIEPFKSLLAGDTEAVLASGKQGVLDILAVSHANMSTEQFELAVEEWISNTKDKRFGKTYDQLIYAPMLQLLEYLRAHDFKTFIVSGGGIDFMRVFSEEVYGISPDQVVGSSIATSYSVINGVPTLTRQPELFFIDDKEGKPVGIHHFIGQRPIAAFGNSDGDFEMIEWTKAGEGKRLGMFVHHTDADREYAYDREGHVGVLNRGMDEAAERGWYLIDMKEDWKTVFE